MVQERLRLMQTDVFDFMALFGFILSLGLAVVKFLEYRMKSEQHRPYLKLAWDNLPPRNPQVFNKFFLCIENCGTKEARVLEASIKFSYNDQRIIIPGGIIDPGQTTRHIFDYEAPPVGEHKISGFVTIKHGRFRERKRTHRIHHIFVKK